jgi:predicted RNase H-like HicB family nuclease
MLIMRAMLKIEFDREVDGRWIAEAPELPGVLAYGATRDEARGHAMALALHVIADKIEHHEPVPEAAREFFEAA